MIKFKHIFHKFHEEILFNDFNLKINKNEKVLISSPSGSGKSTLVKMLLGFIKPNEGEIYIDDLQLSKHTKNEFRKRISYVSQDVDLRNLIVSDLIDEILSYKVNKHIKLSKKQTEELFLKYHLDKSYLNKRVSELSGGQRARLGLIITIILDREIMIFDEITSGLDENLKKLIVKDIISLNKTVIIISHDTLWKDENLTVVNLKNEY